MKRDINKDLHCLLKAFAKNLQIDNCEYGGIGLNNKRPFGNSDVEGDILEIIGLEYNEEIEEQQREYARRLYTKELIPYIKRKILEDIND